MNYEINPEHLTLWKLNKIFVRIKNQEQYDILKKFRNFGTSDDHYMSHYTHYCYMGYCDRPNLTDKYILKSFDFEKIINFEDLIIYDDNMFHIEELNKLYTKINNNEHTSL